jgi:hypothetical protein
MSGSWQPPASKTAPSVPPLPASKTAPSVSTSYDFSRCQETQKLKSVCLCDACRDGPDLKAIAEQDAAWAAKKRAEKFAELDEIRRSSESTPGGGSSLAAAAAAARAEMPAAIKAAALAAKSASSSKPDGDASTTSSAARPNAPANTFGRDRSYLFAEQTLPVASPAPDPAAGAAPEEWELVEEEGTGRSYWWHPATDEVSWGAPPQGAPAAAASAAAAASPG